MRMRLRRLGGDERGAIVMIVALSLIAMIGFSALVIDVGGLLVTRRRMVRAADSAALAAAQTCARNGTLAAAGGQADHYAGANQAPEKTSAVSGSITDEDGCGTGSGYVTVVYRIDQQTFFAPVLGLPDDYSVPAKATAIWGPAGSGSLPPLMVSSEILQDDCEIPDSEPGTACNFWYSNDQLGSSTWGWLSLFTVDNPGPGGKVGWDVPANQSNCPDSGVPSRDKWLETPVPVPALNFPDPTYVCVDTGANPTNWGTLGSLIPIELLFPVNDSATQVNQKGEIVDQKPHKYNVVGFVTLKVTALYPGRSVEAVGADGTPYESACENSIPGQPHLFEEDPASAADWDISGPVDTCSEAHPEDTISVKVNENKYKNSPGKTNWTYEDGVITWVDFPQSGKVEDATFTLFYSGETDGTPGACSSGGKAPGGSDDPDPQDWCVVTEWVGFTTDGGEPGGGEDFGIRPIRLCAPPDEKCS